MDIGINFSDIINFNFNNKNSKSFFEKLLLCKIMEFKLKNGTRVKDAAKTICLLKLDGYKIHIICDMPFINEKSIEGSKIRILIELFLIENNIPFTTIDFNKDEKYDIMLLSNKDNKFDWLEEYINIFDKYNKKGVVLVK